MDIENSYPEINFPVLKRLFKKWTRKFPSVRKVTAFESTDDNKPYYLVFQVDSTAAAHDDTSNWYIGLCGTMSADLSKVVNHAELNDAEFTNQWKVFTHALNDDTFIPENIMDGGRELLSDDFKREVEEIFSVTRTPLELPEEADSSLYFPELHLNPLRGIASRWIEQYSHRGVKIEDVTLYRYDPGILKQSTSKTRYAMIFTLDREYQVNTEYFKDFETAMSSLIVDPYAFFIMDTGFFNDAESKGLPERFHSNDFDLVHKQPRDSFHREWLIIPSFNGFGLPKGVRINEGHVTLYSGETESFNPYCPPSRDELEATFFKNRENQGKQSPGGTQSQVTEGTPCIDYSRKPKAEQAELARRWKKSGMSRRDIALKLFENDCQNGTSIETLMKRVDRLTSKK